MSTVLSSILKIWDRVPQNGKEALISNLGIKDQNALKLGGAVLRHYIDNAKPIDPYLESQKVSIANAQEKEQVSRNVDDDVSTQRVHSSQKESNQQKQQATQNPTNFSQNIDDGVQSTNETPKPKKQRNTSKARKNTYQSNNSKDMDDDIIDVEWVEIKK